MRYTNCVKLLTVVICASLPLKSAAKPAKESEDAAGIPNGSDSVLSSSPQTPKVPQSLNPQPSFDPDNTDVDVPIVPDDGSIGSIDSNEDGPKENGNTQGGSSQDLVDEVNHNHQPDVNFDSNGKPVISPSEITSIDHNKGDVGENTKSGTELGEGSLRKMEKPALSAGVERPQQQTNLPHVADKPILLDPFDQNPSAGVETAQLPTNLPPVGDKPNAPNPINPTVSVANLPKKSQSDDSDPKETVLASSESPKAPLPISTQSTYEAPITEKSSKVSGADQIVPGMQSAKFDNNNPGKNTADSNSKYINGSSIAGNTASTESSVLENVQVDFDNVVTFTNQTGDGNKKAEENDSADGASKKVTVSPQTKSTLLTTESSNTKSSLQKTSAKVESADTTMSTQKFETQHSDIKDVQNFSPIDANRSISTQKPQTPLLVNNNVPSQKLPHTPISTNYSIHLTAPTSSLQLVPTGSLIQGHPLVNESEIPVTPGKSDDLGGISSSKSAVTTSTSPKSLSTTTNVSISTPTINPVTTTKSPRLTLTIANKPYTTSSTTSTLKVISEKTKSSENTKPLTSTTTTTSIKPAVSPAKESTSSKPPAKSDASDSQEAEHSRKRPSVNIGAGREGGSSIVENRPEVIAPTSSYASVEEASATSNATIDPDFLSKVKDMVGNVQPFYIALTLLIMLTLTLITCCCCCKLCSKKRQGIRHRRLKEYGKEKEFLLRDRGKTSNYHNDSVTLLQGSSEDEF